MSDGRCQAAKVNHSRCTKSAIHAVQDAQGNRVLLCTYHAFRLARHRDVDPVLIFGSDEHRALFEQSRQARIVKLKAEIRSLRAELKELESMELPT